MTSPARFRFGDGSDAFDPLLLSDDLLQVASLYEGLRPYRDSSAWHLLDVAGEWTTAQTIAHLDVMATTGLAVMEDALEGREIHIEGLELRRGLTSWNEATIRERLADGDDVLTSLVTSLRASADLSSRLSTNELHAAVELPIYNAPLTVVELLGIQVFHPGLNHAAQVVDALEIPPLWTRLDFNARHRMITRLTRALGYLYWPERGGSEGLTIGIEVRGSGGGSWRVTGTPLGAEGGEGQAVRPDLRIRFRDTAAACRMFTGRLPLLRALLRGDLRIRGNLGVLRRFEEIFSSDG